MPLVRAFISPEEVYLGRKVTYAEVSAIAATLNRDEALKFLGFLNLLMSAAVAETHLSNNVQPVHDIQTYLFREVVSESLLTELKRTFRDASLLDRPILHRTQLLFAIRLVATHGLAEGGNKLLERQDFDPIGDLLFLINGLLLPAPLTSEAAKALWLATHMGPMHELENPPDLELSWPRIEELLTRRLPAVAANREELERLEQVVVFTNGASIRASIDLSFMFFSFWGTVKFRELMENRGRAYLNPNQQNALISVELLNRVLEGIALKFDEMPEAFRIDAFSPSTMLDLSPFRTKPLWVMPDGLVFCVDAALLMERLGPHVFWTVMNGLDTPARRKQFSSTWGNAFESYCLDALGVVFKGKKWSFRRNVMDGALNEEASDAIASRDGTVLLIECKGTFITTADKYSGVPGRFLRGLSQKFGNAPHGGVFQLLRAIRRVWFSGEARGVVDNSNRVTDVFPILIIQDPIAGCGPVVRVLSDRMKIAVERLDTRASKAPAFWPLTVLTADDVDLLSASIQSTGLRLDAILKRFHRAHPSNMIPIGEFLVSGVNGDFGFPKRVSAIVKERFNAMSAAVNERFTNGEYGGIREVAADRPPPNAV